MGNRAFEFDRALILTITALLIGSKDFQKALEEPSEQPLPNPGMPLCLVLRDIILSRKSAYKTTIAEDAALLENAEVQGRRRMAIEVRLGEKEILAMAADEVEKKIDKLDVTTEQEQDRSHAKRRRF